PLSLFLCSAVGLGLGRVTLPNPGCAQRLYSSPRTTGRGLLRPCSESKIYQSPPNLLRHSNLPKNLDQGQQQKPHPTPWSQSHEGRSEEHTSELQSRFDLVCRLLLET